MSKSKESELQKEFNRIRNDLDKIDERRRRRVNRPYLWKCFVYQNSYGDGTSWPLYLRITQAGSRLAGDKFERTSIGRFEAWTDSYIGNLEGWKEITDKEYSAARAKFLKDLNEAIVT